MKKYILLVAIILLFTGCSKNDDSNTLNVLNWSSYISNDVIDKFEEETGIKVNYNTYSSNEELLAKLSASKEGTYDLVFPSDYMVLIMKEKDMLEELDISKLNNYKNINPIFLNQEYDIDNKYSLPFLAATTVIAYNSSNIKDDITSYNDLLNDKYKNDIVFLDDQRITIGIALLANNYNMNEVSTEKLSIAKDWLLKINDNIKSFDSDSPKTFLMTNEVNIGIMWNAEATIAKNYNDNIKIVYPSEGYAISIDNYTIVKNAKHKDNAYKFIDYLLEYEVSKTITDDYPYINTTIDAANYDDNELNEILKNGYYVKNIGKSIINYDKVWAEIK